jgi:hypothetical protein
MLLNNRNRACAIMTPTVDKTPTMYKITAVFEIRDARKNPPVIAAILRKVAIKNRNWPFPFFRHLSTVRINIINPAAPIPNPRVKIILYLRLFEKV